MTEMVPTLADKFELILTFFAVICGVLSAAYFYDSTDIFVNILKKPLRSISIGMFVIAIGVLLAAVMTYESKFGVNTLTFLGIQLQVFFYSLYIVGSAFIFVGARKFAYRSQ